MLKIAAFAFSICAYGQTCAYTTGKIPQGTVTVFRNGAITRQGPDFTYSKRVITPVLWAAGDKFSATFSIQVPLALPDGTPYTTYRNWQENWDCPGTPPAAGPALLSLQQCTGAGVTLDGAGNIVSRWDCASMLWAKIKLPDGSILSMLGTPELETGGHAVLTTWTPIK